MNQDVLLADVITNPLTAKAYGSPRSPGTPVICCVTVTLDLAAR